MGGSMAEVPLRVRGCTAAYSSMVGLRAVRHTIALVTAR
jgi:hypothetical protein